MKQFKLTVKSDDTELVKKIMHHLRKDFELMDEPDECNRTLEDYMKDIDKRTFKEYISSPDKLIKDLALLVNGNDFPSSVNALKGLKLIGDKYMNDDFCTNCGHPDWYSTGGMMLCGNCEHSEYAEEPFEDIEINSLL